MPPVQRPPIDPPWHKFTNSVEEQRLRVISDRLERKNATTAELIAERKLIMQRAIRRMRRAKGKT